MRKNTNKLRIGFVLDDGLDKPDGVQQYILTLGRWMQRKGHYVRYLVGETKKNDIEEAVVLSKNLKVRFNGNTLSTPLPSSSFKIKKTLAKEKFDVLHIQVPYSPFMAAKVIAHADKHTRIIGTFHVLPLGKVQDLGTRLLGIFLKYNLKKFDKFLSVSEPARLFARRAFGIDSQVLPNVVDLSGYKNELSKRKNTINIVYLGRLVPRKGCMQLLLAVNDLQKSREQKIRLHICGSGNQENKLKKYIDSSRLKDITTMHGFVSEKDKIKLLNQADFAVFPSLAGESFGIVLLEAMAAGSGVVLAGNNPGYSSVFSKIPESLFNPRDHKQLADKMSELIKDRGNFDSLHDKQQKLIKQFDVTTVGNQLLKIYKGSA